MREHTPLQPELVRGAVLPLLNFKVSACELAKVTAQLRMQLTYLRADGITATVHTKHFSLILLSDIHVFMH